MSTFLIRNIRMTLDPVSIGKAIAEIEEIESKIVPAMQNLIRYLTEKGVEIARAELIFFPKPAFYTGELSQSIHSIPYDGTAGYVATDCKYAAYVEFGTGMTGQVSAINPEGRDIGTFKETGWVYFNERDGKFHWTSGMAARPFMYHTYLDLVEEAEAAGGGIVAEYLA